MGNPLFDMMQNNSFPPVLQKFMQFRQNYSGDAKAQVQQMLQSGQITQDQYDKAVQQAQAIQRMLTPNGRR